MNTSYRLAAAALSLLALVAVAGCSGEITPAGSPGADEGEDIAETEEAITARASLAGTYTAVTASAADLAYLDLEASGTFTSETGSRIMESGTWTAAKISGGRFDLRLRSTGKSARLYVAAKIGNGMSLSRNGTTQSLTAAKDPVACPPVATPICGPGTVLQTSTSADGCFWSTCEPVACPPVAMPMCGPGTVLKTSTDSVGCQWVTCEPVACPPVAIPMCAAGTTLVSRTSADGCTFYSCE